MNSNKNKTILIVDDEEDLREILTFNLESEGYCVEQAASAEEALAKELRSVDLILLDVMMPGISGFKMAEQIRKENITEAPIVFLTAKDNENDLLTGFSLGADDYLSKPFSIKELLTRVRAVLKRAQSNSEKVEKTLIRLGGLLIDLNSKTASLNESELQVTKKELEILILLSKEPERVFSRSEILDNVWPDDCYVLERTVDVHIARLRKKLGSSKLSIINRSGYGYCISIEE